MTNENNENDPEKDAVVTHTPTEPEPDADLTIEELREKRMQERIAELRKRDPFIYR